MSAQPKKHQIKLYSLEYFMYCGLGGIISCGLTHTMITPIDLVKCNAQANPEIFKKFGKGLKAIYSGKIANLGFLPGFRGLVTGWGPTLGGYSMQGLGKFGLYEVFKHYYSEAIGEERALKYRDIVYLCGSASAEFFADLLLCPFEAVKVRVQTNPTFARGLFDGIGKFKGAGELYASIVPLWTRQIPYTVIKFCSFERIAEAIYRNLPKKKEDMNQAEQMTVVFTAGYLAGILCAIVSHPADTLVSKINKLTMEGSLGQKCRLIYSGTPEKPGIGFRGLWAGLGPRIVMIGTLTGAQWFIYGAFKAWLGLPTPGGVPQKGGKKDEKASKSSH